MGMKTGVVSVVMVALIGAAAGEGVVLGKAWQRIDKLEHSAGVEGPPGPEGPEGPEGPPGDPAEVSLDDLLGDLGSCTTPQIEEVVTGITVIAGRLNTSTTDALTCG